MNLRAAIRRTGHAWLAAALLAVAPMAFAAECVAPAQFETFAAEARAVAEAASLDAAWQRVVEAARACADPAREAQALSEWSDRARRFGDIDRVLAAEQARADLAGKHGLFAHEADARLKIGMIAVARGELPLAHTQFDAARDRYDRLGDLAGAARAYTELSRLERRRGDYLAALRFELSGLQLRRRTDPPLDLWRSLLSLAVLYEQIELFDEAREYYIEALAEAERTQVPQQIADALNGYAGFLNDFGAESAEPALAMAQRALGLFRGIGDTARIGSSLLQVGRANFALGNFDAAQQAFAESMTQARNGGFEALRAHVEFRWGELELARGNIGEALRRIEDARIEYERQGNRHRLIKVHGVLEKLHAQRGDALAAAAAGREHFRLRNELLGANATGKLGELLTNFALADERNRADALQRENAMAAVRLESEKRLRTMGFALVAIVVAALVLLLWRHATVRRLYRMLSEANAQLTRITLTDSLTGLASRAHGLERLAQLLLHARTRGAEPALLLLDLDFFKEINDRYGHLAGDQVLMSVSKVLKEMQPEDGLAVRVGGEEFVLLLEHADHDRAEMIADAIRRRVRDLQVDVGPQCVQLTVSIGIAHAGENASVRELFTRADRALYEAKRAGRDCVRRA